MRVIGWDTETPLVRPAWQAPPMVCGQWCEIFPGGRVGAGNVALPEDALPHLVSWLRDPECLIVGAETAFDVLVPCTTVDLWPEDPRVGKPWRPAAGAVTKYGTTGAYPSKRELCETLGLDQQCPGTHLLELFVQAYDQNRIADIFVRQKLLDLARGCYRYERNVDGTITGAHKYNLADLSKRVAGLELPGDSKKCSVCDNTGCPACPWRLRYIELAGVAPQAWPREAFEYAALDPVATGAVWVNQWRPSTKVEQNFPGVTVAQVFEREFDEARAALPLKAMSAYGLRTDPGAVAQFEGHVRAEYQAISDDLVRWGLLRREYKRDRAAVQEYVQRAGLDHCFVTQSEVAVATETGVTVMQTVPVWSFAAACFDDAYVHAPLEVVRVLRKVHAGDNKDPELLALGLSYIDETRDTKKAKELITWAHGGVVPKELMTPGGKPRKDGKAPAPPGPKTDKDSLLIAADILESKVGQGTHPLPDQATEAAEALRSYGEFSHLAKQIGTDIPILRDGAERPIHTRYETILETTRTSSSKPNVQNQARGGVTKCRACKGSGCACARKKCEGCEAGACSKCDGEGKRDLAGARECFVPRPGWVLIDADYGMLEIHTLAQTCLWELGYSAMAEALTAKDENGKPAPLDVHLVVAAQIVGVPYAEAKRRFKHKCELGPLDSDGKPQKCGKCQECAWTKEIKESRNAGKAVNFGRPGGLSAKTMRSYAVKSYGVNKTQDEWQAIIDTWGATWTEMPAYFQLVNRAESFPRSGLFNVSYSGVSGYRALATYCAACNTKYQRLGAQVGKRAMWYVFKACYTRTAEGSHDSSGAPVLFGCRPNNFIHDQIMCEAPEPRAHVAAVALAELMNRAGREMLPDVPVKTEPILCRRWSKNAEELRDENGQLVPWEDVRLTG